MNTQDNIVENDERLNEKTRERPKALAVLADNIPAEMKARKQWCLWRYEFRHERWTKVPLQPYNLTRAKSDQSRTWHAFHGCLSRYNTLLKFGRIDGIGYFLAPDDDLIGCDVDHCCNGSGFSETAQAYISTLSSYAEYSPSGEGLRVFARGELPTNGDSKPSYRRGNCEMYDNSTHRFLTVTGHHVEGTPKSVEIRQAEIEQVYLKYVYQERRRPQVSGNGRPQPSESVDEVAWEGLPRGATLDDVVWLVRQTPKYTQLWNGDTSAYQSHSQADQALCTRLAYFVPDAEIIDKLFRQSGLYRGKWERTDYRERTITKALGREDSFEWDSFVPDHLVDEIVTPFEQGCAKGGDAMDAPFDHPSSDDPPYMPKPKPTPKRRRQGYTPAQLATLPPVKWHVDNHFPQEGLVCLVGASGACKSFIGLDYSLCVATGKPYLDAYNVVPGPVTYIAAEGRSGIVKRIDAWMKHYGHIKYPKNLCIIPDAFNLLDDAEADEILEITRETVGALPKMIVVDTLARSFGSGSENDTGDMNAFIATVDRMKSEAGATAIIVHHTGWQNTNRERGNSALRGAADTIMLISETDGRNGVLVDCVKQKDFEQFETYQLTKRQIILNEAEEETSLVLLADKSVWDTRYRLLSAPRKELISELYRAFALKPFTWSQAWERTDSMKSKSSFSQAVKHLAGKEFLTKQDDGQLTINKDCQGALLAC